MSLVISGEKLLFFPSPKILSRGMIRSWAIKQGAQRCLPPLLCGLWINGRKNDDKHADAHIVFAQPFAAGVGEALIAGKYRGQCGERRFLAHQKCSFHHYLRWSFQMFDAAGPGVFFIFWYVTNITDRFHSILFRMSLWIMLSLSLLDIKVRCCFHGLVKNCKKQ